MTRIQQVAEAFYIGEDGPVDSDWEDAWDKVMEIYPELEIQPSSYYEFVTVNGQKSPEQWPFVWEVNRSKIFDWLYTILNNCHLTPE
jgi:hypothetical protein